MHLDISQGDDDVGMTQTTSSGVQAEAQTTSSGVQAEAQTSSSGAQANVRPKQLHQGRNQQREWKNLKLKQER